MTKYIKPETTVVNIENDSLMTIGYHSVYNPSNTDLAKPNPNINPDLLDKNGVW